MSGEDQYELPDPEPVVLGAELGWEFDWAGAGDLVESLMGAATKLESQLGERSDLVFGDCTGQAGEGIEDWRGPFRDEFDEASGTLITDSVNLKEELLALVQAIVDAAHDVNEAQFDRNQDVLDGED